MLMLRLPHLKTIEMADRCAVPQYDGLMFGRLTEQSQHRNAEKGLPSNCTLANDSVPKYFLAPPKEHAGQRLPFPKVSGCFQRHKSEDSSSSDSGIVLKQQSDWSLKLENDLLN